MSGARKDPGGVVVSFPRRDVARATVRSTREPDPAPASAAGGAAPAVDVRLKRHDVRDRFLHPGGGGDAA